MAITLTESCGYEDAPLVEVEVGGFTIPAVVDTGAKFSVFDAEVAEAIGLDLNGPPIQKIVGLDLQERDFPRRSLFVRVYSCGVLLKASQTRVVFVPDIGRSVIGNLVGRSLLEILPFALDHGSRTIYF